MGFLSFGAAALLTVSTAYNVDSQSNTVAAQPAPALTYADAADLALAAPIVAHVRIVRASPLRPRDAGNVVASHRRFLVEAQIVSLIRSPDTLPARIRYLVDLPDDSRGRAARLAKRSEHLLLAAPVPGRPGELQLVAADAQLPYSPATAARLRDILGEAASPNPAPAIARIGRAFHVPGAIPGESETQFFLQTVDGRPVSLSVLRRPGETPRWAVSLAEIVDEAAEAPRPETLLWYRLACTLPRSLPAQSIADSDPAERAAIAADYRLIIDGLGPCTRNRTRR